SSTRAIVAPETPAVSATSDSQLPRAEWLIPCSIPTTKQLPCQHFSSCVRVGKILKSHLISAVTFRVGEHPTGSVSPPRLKARVELTQVRTRSDLCVATSSYRRKTTPNWRDMARR